MDMQDMKQAETYILQACQLYQSHFPRHIWFANSLWNLAHIYEDTGRQAEAMESLQTAKQIYMELGRVDDELQCTLALKQLSP